MKFKQTSTRGHTKERKTWRHQRAATLLPRYSAQLASEGVSAMDISDLKRESGRQDRDDGRQLLKLQNAKVSVHFRTWPSDTALELHVIRPERAIFSSKGKVEDKTGMMGDNS